MRPTLPWCILLMPTRRATPPSASSTPTASPRWEPGSPAGAKNSVAALKKIEPTAFFQQFRVKALSVLYSIPFAYAHFGYEGEAFSKGGYLTRGFNDLRWLPEVPPSDAGPLPGAAS